MPPVGGGESLLDVVGDEPVEGAVLLLGAVFELGEEVGPQFE